MKVRDIMTAQVSSCRPDNNLAEVATEMWHRDCGILPVVGDDGRVTGMITDRDICVAVGTRGLPAGKIAVRDVTAGTLFTCSPVAEVKDALETMRLRKVRRLPVVDETGHLKGIVSLNDIVLRAGQKGKVATADDVLVTLQSICDHEQQIATVGVV